MTMAKQPVLVSRANARRVRILHRLTVACGIGLAVLAVAYGFLIGPSVFRGNAAETLLCLRICAQGVNPCVATTCANPAGVSTQAVTSITQTTAQGNGTVSSDGGDTVTDRGMVLATKPVSP